MGMVDVNPGTLSPLKSKAFGDITDSLTALGSVFSEGISLLVLSNATNVTLIFGVESATDMIALPAGTVLEIPYGQLQGLRGTFSLRKGSQIYVRHLTGSAPTSGAAYAMGLFNQTP